jgi:CheY-like chemotaxis protein
MTKRILVVEDREDNRQIMRDLLPADRHEHGNATATRTATSAGKIIEVLIIAAH